jgi:hypothetical protein
MVIAKAIHTKTRTRVRLIWFSKGGRKRQSGHGAGLDKVDWLFIVAWPGATGDWKTAKIECKSILSEWLREHVTMIPRCD